MVVTSKDVTEADVQAMLAAGNVTVVEEDRKIIDMGTVTEATRVTTSADGKTVTEEKTVIKREGDGGVKILEESKTTKPRSRSKSSSSSSSSSSSDEEKEKAPAPVPEPAPIIQAEVRIIEKTKFQFLGGTTHFCALWGRNRVPTVTPIKLHILLFYLFGIGKLIVVSGILSPIWGLISYSLKPWSPK